MDRVLEYLAHHPWLSTATALVAALVFAYEMRARSDNKVTVSPQELIRLMNQGALVLDLRPQEQYQAGHLNGARQMSGEQILKAADALKKYKEKPVVVYDDSGALGGPAVRQLAGQLIHAGMALAEPLPAELERRAVRQHQALSAAADALTSLDHGDLVPARHEPPGSGQSGQPGADHDDVAHLLSLIPVARFRQRQRSAASGWQLSR